MNIYSPVHITASDQEKGSGAIWKPVDGVIKFVQKAAWISLQSSRSWWRMELPHRSTIYRVVIYTLPSGTSNPLLVSLAMTGLTVYIGDIPHGNGSRNAMCGNLSKSTTDTVININCINPGVGKYLYVAAADKEKAALYLVEIKVYGCEGYYVCLCFNFDF